MIITKQDLISGFIVFLIALPLCLGISLASGFPPIAGIYSAILGGVFGIFGGSPLTIKGPAAGLIVIILSSVQELGDGNNLLGYKLTLGIIVVSGFIQILFGLLKLGGISKFFPKTVIHGMMASIGIIIIIKQIYPLMGLEMPTETLWESLVNFPYTIYNWKWEIAMIGIISLFVMTISSRVDILLFRKIPAPLIVVSIGIFCTIALNVAHVGDGIFFAMEDSILGEEFLVNIPANFIDGIQFPDFTSVLSLLGLKFIILLSVIGSIESLLTVSAIDTMDNLKRKSNMDRDLMSIGLANTISGFIGGLPMISEIVRSSANVQNGGITWIANLSHGIFLFIFVAFIPNLIHLIPLSALSGILVYTGIRLVSLKRIRMVLSEGWKSSIVYFVTVATTILTDLLMGLLSGMIIYYLIFMKFNQTENQ